MSDHTVVLRSGRGVGVSSSGDPLSRRLVVLCLPTPGAGKFDPNPLITNRWGVHLLTVDRPGYGGSDPLGESDPWSFEARADDVAEYVRRAERAARDASTDFGTIGAIGWGTGGLVALRLAARNPGLVDRLVLVGTRAPSARADGDVLEARHAEDLQNLAEVTAHLTSELPLGIESLGVQDGDPALEIAGLRSRIERMLTDAGENGVAGVATDLLAVRDARWNDSVDSSDIDALLVYGEQDPVADTSDAEWFAGRLGRSRTLTVPGAGRLAIATAWEEILEHVAPRHGDIPAEER